MCRFVAILLFLITSLVLSGVERAYVVDLGTNAVTVIDVATDTAVVQIVSGFSSPIFAMAKPDGTKVYVINQGSSSVSVIDTSTNLVVATIPVGAVSTSPGGSGLITPDGSKLYVANTNDGTVSVVNTASNTVIATITVGSRDVLFSSSILPNGTEVYTADASSNTVSVINTSSDTLAFTIPVGTGPECTAASPDGTQVYVADFTSQEVSIIDTGTHTVIATIPIPGSRMNPSFLAFNPSGTEVYTTNGIVGGTVSVINTASQTIVATITVGLIPDFVVFNSTGTRAYVTNSGEATMSVIDTAARTVIATVNLTTSSNRFFGIVPDGTKIYFPTPASNNLKVISTASNTVTAIVNTGSGSAPRFVVFANAQTPTPPVTGPGVPTSVQGSQRGDCFFSQTDLINVVRWNASSGGTTTTVQYKVYRDGALTDLVATIPANAELEIEDHNRHEDTAYIYYIVAVDGTGGTSSPATVIVPPNENINVAERDRKP